MIKFLFISLMATVLLSDEASADWLAWVKLNRDLVCFEAKDNQYGSFIVDEDIAVASLMLVHRSGSVNCNVYSSSSGESNWGCNDERINVHLTDQSNEQLVPAASVPLDNYAYYNMPGYTSNSPVLVFCQDFSFSKDQQLRLWFGEDLIDNGESDNSGESCVDVYGLQG